MCVSYNNPSPLLPAALFEFSPSTPLSPMPSLGEIGDLLAKAYTSRRRSFMGDVLRVGQVSTREPGTPRRLSIDAGNVDELVERLREEDNIYDQAGILNHLHNS